MRTSWIGLYCAALLAALLLAACGGNNAGGQGDASAGKQLFDGQIALADRAALPCKECHSVEPGGPASTGPNLSNIGNRAGATVAGQTAADYLLTSIVDPDVYLAGNFQDGLMYRGYRRALTASQVNDLVAYMLTLKSGRDN
jgi:cytochrome c2